MDPAELLQAREGDSPSGENLEYDPLFMEMELAAQPGEERQIGDEVTEAHDPDYAEMRRTALAVLDKSHDMRAAIILADACLHDEEGLQGFAGVTSYLRGLVEQHWDTCHPQLDEDDGDPTMRINAIQGLCGQPEGMAGPSPVYRSLRRTALSESRGFGRFTLRDIEIAEGQMVAPPDIDVVPDTATIAAAFQDSDDEVLSTRLAAARQAVEDVRAISATFDEQTPGQGPELDPLIKLLDNVARRLADYGGAAAADAAADGEGAPEDDIAETAATPVAGVPGAINSPADVANALDRIIAYYQRHEPSSPIPLLLERAKKLVSADFLTIMMDMAPQGISNVHLIGGIEDED